MHHFSVPLTSTQRKIRASGTKTKKRKHDSIELEDPSSEAKQHVTEAADVSGAAASIVLSPDEIRQYRVAGQPLDEPLPGGHFPHAAPKPAHEKDLLLEAKKGPQGTPYLLPSKDALRTGSTLRQQHLAVVTAVLHRCLLNGDFERAGRAWAMLLRSELGKGEHFDVRADGRWGIGAEILLRRGSRGRAAETEPSAADDTAAAENLAAFPSECFDEEGFEAAKDYYERLILQYPYRKSHPHAVSATHFYPALFSLWIYQVQGKSKQARRQLRLRESSRASSESMLGEDRDEESNDRQAQEAEIRTRELREALGIAERMDAVIVSPPYDKHAVLLRFRGMVELWIGDLQVTEADQDEVQDVGAGTSVPDESMDRLRARRRHAENLARRERHFRRARSYFQRAADAGGGEVWQGVKRTDRHNEDVGEHEDYINP